MLWGFKKEQISPLSTSFGCGLEVRERTTARAEAGVLRIAQEGDVVSGLGEDKYD